jgi:AcrR family transcriptional regulator
MNRIHFMGIQERKQRERERRKQQIIVAAKRVFVEKGYGRATMEGIAKEAELSAGTLYLYFRNKSELWATLSVRVLQYLLIRLDHLHSQTELDHKGKISQLKAVLLDVYEFDPMIFKNLFNLQTSETLKELSPELIDEINTLRQQTINKIAAVFQQGINKGVCLDRHPIEIADIFWSMFSGVVLWGASEQNGVSTSDRLKPTLETAFEIFEKGIFVQEETVV